MAQFIITLLQHGESFVEESQRLESALHKVGSVYVNKGGGHALFTVITKLDKKQVQTKVDELHLAGTTIVGEENDNEMAPA